MYACFVELHRFVSTILFSRRFVMKASQIAMLVNGSLIGDPDIVVLKPSKIEEELNRAPFVFFETQNMSLTSILLKLR